MGMSCLNAHDTGTPANAANSGRNAVAAPKRGR
jgi:hypothetical protein